MSTATPLIPYSRQCIEEDDIQSVLGVLSSDFLTQGPKVQEFENAFAARVGSRHAVALNSGTAALHACMNALDIGPGDEVIVPAISFVATANCVCFVGGRPVFADVLETGHIDPLDVERKISCRTKAVISVDYAGWPCNYASLREICARHGLALVCDACHALGARWNNESVGSIGLLNCFSFHPVKHITTGEGGMVTTDDSALAERIREFRTHGITRCQAKFRGLGALRGQTKLVDQGPWYYEMQSLGFNYRMPDINAALGLSQLEKLDRFVTNRRKVAEYYYQNLCHEPFLKLPVSDVASDSKQPFAAFHSFHLFPVLIDFDRVGMTRSELMTSLKRRGIGTQVHYIPIYRQPFYEKFKTEVCPQAELFYARELSLPVYASMEENEMRTVVEALREVIFTGKK